MRSIRLFAVVVLAVVLALSSTQGALASALDQVQEVDTGNWNLDYDSPSSYLGQSFQPSLPILNTVEVKITVDTYTTEITLNIRQGTISGPILASASRSVVASFGTDWVYFVLGSVSVTPGSTYVIELINSNSIVNNGHANWQASDSDSYPKGSAIVQGTARDFDFTFRTWGESGNPPTGAPVGGFIEPVNKLDIFAPYMALFGVIAAVAIVVAAPWKKREE